MGIRQQNQQPPPQSTEAEMGLLAGMVLNPYDTIPQVQEILASAEDLYLPAHKIIYKILCEEFKTGVPADLIILREKLTQSNQLEKIGGSEYISEFMMLAYSPTDTIKYAESVKETANRRRLIDIGQKLIQYATEVKNNLTSSRIASQAGKALKKITDFQDRNDLSVARSTGDTIQQGMDAIFLRKKNRLELGRVYPTQFGFPDLDKLVHLAPSRLIVIGGRPGHGKTTLALNMILHNLIQGVAGIFFSLEMDRETLGMNAIIQLLRMDASKARDGKIDELEEAQIRETAEKWKAAAGLIVDSPEVSIEGMRRVISAAMRKQPIQYAIIDYMQILATESPSESERLRVSHLVRGAKTVAKEFQIPIIALAQPNRKCEDRKNPDKRPMVSDLAESSMFDAEADAIFFVYRGWLYDEKEYNNFRIDEHSMEFIIRKNRYAENNKTVRAYCDMSRCLIETPPKKNQSMFGERENEEE